MKPESSRSMDVECVGTQVLEPNPTLSTPLTTNYTHYAALREVNQSELVRTFTYDWLGRMLNETHPESGSTKYTPYANGSVHTRTDARGAVTTTATMLSTGSPPSRIPTARRL